MKKIHTVVYGITCLWGIIAFASTMMLFVPFIWLLGILPEPDRTAWTIRLCKWWMALFFPLAGIRVIIKGREQFKEGENYIVVCNHNSMMDVPLSSPGIPGANKTIAKIEMSRIPLFGIIYKRGSVLIDRKKESSRKESYDAMKKVLAQGMHMCIYPEGTRNKTNLPLKEFHDGAFRLSKDTGKKIIPCIIRGTKEMLPSDKGFYFKPGKVSMEFLPPVDPQAFASTQLLKLHIFQLMWDTIEQGATEYRSNEYD